MAKVGETGQGKMKQHNSNVTEIQNILDKLVYININSNFIEYLHTSQEYLVKLTALIYNEQNKTKAKE